MFGVLEYNCFFGYVAEIVIEGRWLVAYLRGICGEGGAMSDRFDLRPIGPLRNLAITSRFWERSGTSNDPNAGDQAWLTDDVQHWSDLYAGTCRAVPAGVNSTQFVPAQRTIVCAPPKHSKKCFLKNECHTGRGP